MLYPTISATTVCMKIANKKFPKLHHLHNPANAFRHALWNALIAHKAQKWNGDTQKALSWAEKITNWHEDFSPNEALARAMDLHNNKVGRSIFNNLKTKQNKVKTIEIINETMVFLEGAQQVKQLSDLSKYLNQLVYIND